MKDVMRCISLFGAVVFLCLVIIPRPVRGEILPVAETVMKKVFDWQLANLSEYVVTSEGEQLAIRNNDWIRCTLFIGIMAAYYSTKDENYLKVVSKWAEENKWQLGPIQRHADDQCAGQIYVELYLMRKDPKMIIPVRKTLDMMISSPKPGREEWWWSDALFMAPPMLARFSTATGEKKYLDFMNKMWWDTTEFLYDSEEHLYYRDSRHKSKKDGPVARIQNGKKTFWGRGNGWVMAGTVRVLQYMPQNYPDRNKYIDLLKEMSAKIAVLQSNDGLWRASLLGSREYPIPETSSSGLFCYAIAWGINNGILEKQKYLPVVEKAWKGLVGAVDESGKLGWVQQPAADPQPVKQDDTMEYGVGAFLLAGSEIIKLR